MGWSNGRAKLSAGKAADFRAAEVSQTVYGVSRDDVGHGGEGLDRAGGGMSPQSRSGRGCRRERSRHALDVVEELAADELLEDDDEQ
jgi:hypothetical protein